MASLETVSKRVFPLISQIGINYRDAALSEHTDDEFEDVKAGDRLPYFLVDGKTIFDKLCEPKFHLLVFSNADQTIGKDFEREFGAIADYHVVPIDSRVSEIFGTDEEFSVFLRPDNHIAFISSQISLDKVREYLERIHEGVSR
jgi:hypothetical protein